MSPENNISTVGVEPFYYVEFFTPTYYNCNCLKNHPLKEPFRKPKIFLLQHHIFRMKQGAAEFQDGIGKSVLYFR